MEDRRLLSATPYVVDSLADVVALDGMVTFREALQAANTNTAVGDAHPGSSSETDVITFDPGLFAEGPGSLVMEQGGFSIEDAVEIRGPGASELRIETGSLSVGFTVRKDVEASISGVTVAGAGKGTYRLCGVDNRGNLELAGVVIIGHYAGGNLPTGAGIYNEGALVLESCAVVGNHADAAGGGIYSTGPMTIINSTIAGNYAGRQGGGIHSEIPFTMVNSIVCMNSISPLSANQSIAVAEINGAMTAASGRNLIGIDPLFVEAPSDGGDGWADDRHTHDIDESANNNYGDLRLQPDSPAIDVGHDASASSLSNDLDAQARLSGSHVDVGAFESQQISGNTLETPSTVVTTLADTLDFTDGLISLREAVFYAEPGGVVDEVSFDPALEGETILLDGDAIRVDAAIRMEANSLDSLTIDGAGESSVLLVYSTVLAEGLTIRGGLSGQGGGVLNFGHLTLRDVIVRENEAAEGAGIYNAAGTLVIEDSTITRNSSDQFSVIGGGIYNKEGTLICRRSSVSENVAKTGGGIRSEDGTIEIDACRICGNAATGSSGGILSSDDRLLLTNSLLVGNTSGTTGGGIISTGDATIVNSTIVGNSARDEYGGVGGDPILYNSIVAMNEAVANPNTTYELRPGGFNTIGNDPFFVRDPDDGGDGWADNPNTPDIDERTNNDYGDLRLASSSLAIDLGADAYMPSSIAADIDGNPRFHGARIDLGAYEFQGTVSEDREAASAIVTTLEDRVDPLDGVVSLREAIMYAGLDSTGSEITFDETLRSGEILLGGEPLFLDKSITILAPLDAPVTLNAGGLSTVICVSADSAELENLIITGGYAESGGGIYGYYSGLTLRNCTVTRNRAQTWGGGLYHECDRQNDEGYLNLQNCEVSSNWARQGGGVMLIGDGNIRDSRVFANHGLYGGGIRAALGELEVINSAVYANYAYQGGGIYSEQQEISLVFVTVAGNTASYGGGMYLNRSAELVNSIVCMNAAKFGSDVYPDNPYRDITISHALIDTDPQFLRLPDDGGDGFGDHPDTPDVDESANDDYGDLRLAEGSPAIDAATRFHGIADMTVDLAGNPRKVPWELDIGAYEYSLPGDLDGDGLVGSKDLEIVRSRWGETVPAARLAMGDPSGDGRIGGDDLDIVRANWGRTPSAAAASRTAENKAADVVFSGLARKRTAAGVLSLAETQRRHRERKELRDQHALVDLALAGME